MHQILIPYVSMADMLVETFGKSCEVVLHDLNSPEHSVVYVAGDVTHRKQGQNFDHLVKEVMLSDKLNNNYVANHYFEAGGKLIRSSTQLIFDQTQQLVGALCINIDTTPITEQIAYLNTLLPNLNQIKQTEQMVETEELPFSAIAENLMDKILDGQSVQTMTRDKKIEKIRFMEQKGLFLMKGSIDKAAEKLGVNKVTIYSYLDEVRGKR